MPSAPSAPSPPSATPDAPDAPVLLLTRPADDSRRFAARFDLAAVIAPVLRIVPVAHDGAALRAAGSVLLTSRHAVAACGPGAGRVAWCVGAATAAAARAAGFDVITGPGDAAGLAPMLARAGAAGPVIHARGAHLAADLGVPGVVVYDQQALAPGDGARAVLAGSRPVIVPLFSPRSARLVGGWAQGAAAPLWLAPISAAARAAWGGACARCVVAPRPDADGVAQAVNALLGGEQ